MTKANRIFTNVLVTYGRTLYGTICGLFTSRWILASLGEIDYGLFGLIGGLTAFIGFFNGLLSGAVSRFYALSIGRKEIAIDKMASLEGSRRWFNSAVLIHSVIPVFLLLIGYPLGVLVINNFLTIPLDRIDACQNVFIFTCMACFIGMVNIPFHAMFIAKQYMVELTLYGFISSTANIILGYYMITHSGDWLSRYAFIVMLISIVPQIVIMVRAFYVFPECRLRLAYLVDLDRVKQIFAYAGWQMFGCFGGMFKAQGSAILINKYFGPSVNATMNIANMVNAQAGSLTAAMYGAFMPAIATAFGAGDFVGMRDMADRASKFGLILSLVLVCPLIIEINEIMRLWLKHPPMAVCGLSILMMIILVIDKSTIGHLAAVNAKGVIAAYQTILGTILLLTVPLAWIFIFINMGVYAIGYAMVVTMSVCAIIRVIFARNLLGMSFRKWVFKDCLPGMVCAIVASVIALPFHCYMQTSIVRVILVGVVFEVTFTALSWAFALDICERRFVHSHMKAFVGRIRGDSL